MKKKIPLEVLQKIEPLIRQYSDVMTPILDIDASLFYRFIDRDPQSDYFFVIGERNNNGKHYINYIPYERNSVKPIILEVPIDEVTNHLTSWVTILDKINTEPSIYDDPIQKTYQKYYYDEYKIVDEDADYAPFDPPRVFFLEEHLETVKEFVDTNIALFKDPKVAESIKASCDDLIEELTSSPKNVVMKKLTDIWAKISKSGTTLMKSFLKDFGSELKKELIEKGVGRLITLLNEHSDDIADIAANLGQ